MNKGPQGIWLPPTTREATRDDSVCAPWLITWIFNLHVGGARCRLKKILQTKFSRQRHMFSPLSPETMVKLSEVGFCFVLPRDRKTTWPRKDRLGPGRRHRFPCGEGGVAGHRLPRHVALPHGQLGGIRAELSDLLDGVLRFVGCSTNVR